MIAVSYKNSKRAVNKFQINEPNIKTKKTRKITCIPNIDRKGLQGMFKVKSKVLTPKYSKKQIIWEV